MRRDASPWVAFSIVIFLSVGVLVLTTDQAKTQSSEGTVVRNPAPNGLSFHEFL